jgi:hypothetical protein
VARRPLHGELRVAPGDRSMRRKNGLESRSQQDMCEDVKVPIRKVSMSFERFKRWFRRTAGSAEDAVEGGSPVATSPPGANPVGGDVEQETSTNAQMEGAADEPWPGNT